MEPQFRVLLQPGVFWEQNSLVDEATRERIQITGPRDGAEAKAEILMLGLGFTPHSFRDRLTLLLAALSMRTTSPWKMIRYGFRRRVPDAAFYKVLLATCAAGRIPAISMLMVFVVPAVFFGAWWGSTSKILTFAILGAVTCWVSVISHEVAHLVAIRSLERDTSIGAIVHTWLNVQILGPQLSPGHRRLVAAAGPIMGISTSLTLNLVGIPHLICLGVAGMHLVNFVPSAPDGRALFS